MAKDKLEAKNIETTKEISAETTAEVHVEVKVPIQVKTVPCGTTTTQDHERRITFLEAKVEALAAAKG